MQLTLSFSLRTITETSQRQQTHKTAASTDGLHTAQRHSDIMQAICTQITELSKHVRQPTQVKSSKNRNEHDNY